MDGTVFIMSFCQHINFLEKLMKGHQLPVMNYVYLGHVNP